MVIGRCDSGIKLASINQRITTAIYTVPYLFYSLYTNRMGGAGEQLSAERLLRTLERGKQPDTLGTKIGQALELITTILDDLG